MTLNFGRPATAKRAIKLTGPTMIRANSVDLCIQTFGEATDLALLLINGGAASMDWWEDDFCELLATGGRFVIRYDHRDTGRSTHSEPGVPGYTVADLAADAIGILDVLGIERAHIAGMSMGGGIAQRIAVEHPDRVATLTLISTSPGGPGLPPMSETLADAFSKPDPEPDWTDREAVIAYMVDGERPFAGEIPFDEDRTREIAERVVDRTLDMAAGMANHGILEQGDPIRPRLGEISARTLVLHGTADPMFPYGHAEALAREIPGAHLVPIEGGGHQMPPRQRWDVIIPAILDHTANGERP